MTTTVSQLSKLLIAALADRPDLATAPVHMYSDAEGNQEWEFSMAAADVDDDGKIVCMVLIPGHEELGIDDEDL